ncbi:FUSC family protein [Clostridium argentinense]|uniref:FUSC family protein n=1 Tax=Clostridium argentinense TaxID=29341 RepID=UPI0013D3D363|nr:aromatic acid exporter family protein [Clostridium argentinense]NFF38809.1 hypothetical protein [Clostridium argentinense]
MKRIGMRNIKTALSVGICIILLRILRFDSPFYACIAAVITMQTTVENSFQAGKNRLIGTTIGAIIGIIFSYIAPHSSILTVIGVSLIIYITNILHENKSANIACVVFLVIMINLKTTSPLQYGISRFIETAIGIIVAVIVNRYICPYNIIKNEKIEKLGNENTKIIENRSKEDKDAK